MLHFVVHEKNIDKQGISEKIQAMIQCLFHEYMPCYELLPHENMHIQSKDVYTSAGQENHYIVDYPTNTAFIYDICTSTQDTAKVLYAVGELPVWANVMCMEQTKGRGQGGSAWHSTSGNICATVRLPKDSIYTQDSTTVILGAMLSHFLRTLGVQAHNKWINDILLNNAKIAGLLLEQEGDCILLGMGINLHMPTVSTNTTYSTKNIEQKLYPITAIREHIVFPYSAFSIVEAFIAFLQIQMPLYQEKSPPEQQVYLEQYLAYKNTPVELHCTGEGTVYGTLHGLTPTGAIVIEHNGIVTEYMEGVLRTKQS